MPTRSPRRRLQKGPAARWLSVPWSPWGRPDLFVLANGADSNLHPHPDVTLVFPLWGHVPQWEIFPQQQQSVPERWASIHLLRLAAAQSCRRATMGRRKDPSGSDFNTVYKQQLLGLIFYHVTALSPWEESIMALHSPDTLDSYLPWFF